MLFMSRCGHSIQNNCDVTIISNLVRERIWITPVTCCTNTICQNSKENRLIKILTGQHHSCCGCCENRVTIGCQLKGWSRVAQVQILVTSHSDASRAWHCAIPVHLKKNITFRLKSCVILCLSQKNRNRHLALFVTQKWWPLSCFKGPLF